MVCDGRRYGPEHRVPAPASAVTATTAVSDTVSEYAVPTTTGTSGPSQRIGRGLGSSLRSDLLSTTTGTAPASQPSSGIARGAGIEVPGNPVTRKIVSTFARTTCCSTAPPRGARDTTLRRSRRA